jgi:hypothetical protein
MYYDHPSFCMGATISRENCVDLRELPLADLYALLNETYTVIRTSGEEEEGWKIRDTQHKCGLVVPGCYGPYATNQYESRDGIKHWKFFMDNGSCCDDEDHNHRPHACGYRTCDEGRRTFWPTRLKPDQREGWWRWLDERVRSLQKIEANPSE